LALWRIVYTYFTSAKIQEGAILQSYTLIPENIGDSAKLINLPSGGLIHNISLHPKGLGQIHAQQDVLQFGKKRIRHVLLKLK